MKRYSTPQEHKYELSEQEKACFRCTLPDCIPEHKDCLFYSRKRKRRERLKNKARK